MNKTNNLLPRNRSTHNAGNKVAAAKNTRGPAGNTLRGCDPLRVGAGTAAGAIVLHHTELPRQHSQQYSPHPHVEGVQSHATAAGTAGMLEPPMYPPEACCMPAADTLLCIRTPLHKGNAVLQVDGSRRGAPKSASTAGITTLLSDSKYMH